MHVFPTKIEKLKIALHVYQYKREIHTVTARAAPGDLGLKSHPKDLSTEIDIRLRSPIQAQTKVNVA